MTEPAVIVTVALGESVTLTPHPSGLAQLPGLRLEGGSTLRVTAEEARRLLSERRILDPRTGKPVPAPRDESGRVAFFDGEGRVLSAQPSWPQEAQYPTEVPPPDDRPAPPRHPSRGG